MRYPNPGPSRSLIRVWLHAIRLRSLTASAMPVLVGTLLAASERFNPIIFLMTLVASVAIQVGTNLANDYFDCRQQLDAARELRPDMTIQTGELDASAFLRATIAAFSLALLLGLVLISRAGLAVLWLGLASAFAGYAYTAAPFKLGYRAMGELLVSIFMGPVIVEGAYYVEVHHWAWAPGLASIPIALLVTAFLHANNLRDMEDDRAQGKRTLANLFGRRGAVLELRLLVLGAYVALVALHVTGVFPKGALLALITLPFAIVIAVRAGRARDLPSQNRLLLSTAALHLYFGLTLSAGLLLSLARLLGD